MNERENYYVVSFKRPGESSTSWSKQIARSAKEAVENYTSKPNVQSQLELEPEIIIICGINQGGDAGIAAHSITLWKLAPPPPPVEQI